MASIDDTGSYPQYALIAIIGWIMLSLLSAPGVYLQRSLEGEAPHADTVLGVAFVASLAWPAAAFLLLVFSAWLNRRRPNPVAWWTGHGAFGVVLLLLLAVLMRWWNWPVLGLADTLRASAFNAALAVAWSRGLVIYAAIWCACHIGLMWRKCEHLKAQLVSAELRRLRTQLNPHFLFNTLTAISELGYTDPEAADRTITQLSGLLRKSLDDSHQQEIALRDELDFLRRYLDIQQTLRRGRLQIEFEIAENTLNARVPGMILQPLVENALIHGVDHSGTGDIRLRSRRENETLVIEVEDNGRGMVIADAHGESEGIGIGNTRARLNYLYGGLAGLELESRAGQGLTVRLRIPFHEAFAFDENPHVDR